MMKKKININEGILVINHIIVLYQKSYILIDLCASALMFIWFNSTASCACDHYNEPNKTLTRSREYLTIEIIKSILQVVSNIHKILKDCLVR